MRKVPLKICKVPLKIATHEICKVALKIGAPENM